MKKTKTTKQAPEFRTLFSWQTRGAKGLVDEVLATFPGARRAKASEIVVPAAAGGNGLVLSVGIHSKAGDPVIQTAAGACAFLRSKRMGKDASARREAVCGRLYQTQCTVGVLAQDGFTESELARVSVLARTLGALVYEGFEFRDAEGRLALDTKGGFDADAMPPVYLARHVLGERGGGTPRDLGAEHPVFGRWIADQWAFFARVRPTSREARARMEAVVGLLPRVEDTVVLEVRGDPSAAMKEALSVAAKVPYIVTDGWCVRDARGRLWVDRAGHFDANAELGA